MKRGVKMGALLAALVALGGGYAMILIMNKTQSVSETAGSYPLWDENKAVSALEWTMDETDYAFAKGESVWMREGDETFPVNQTAIENMVTKISGLTADRQLTDVGELADYGLDEPAFSVTVGDADGGEITYAMGDATPFDDGYYLSVSGDDAVYVISTSLETAFDKTLAQLAVMEDMPAAENVTGVSVGEFKIVYDAESETWADGATGEVLDTELAQGFADDAVGLTWSDLIKTNATDEQLTEWALDDAQAVKVVLYDGENAVRTLLLGGEDEDGDRYAKLPDSRMVYTIYSGDMSGVLEASAETLWDKTPVKLAAEEITGAAFTWDGGQKTLTAQDMESETAQNIAAQLTALKGTARAALETDGAPVLTVSIEGIPGKTDGEGDETVTATDAEASAKTLSQTIEIYAYNVDSYWIEITGGTGMLVDAGDVDKLIRMLRQEG